jgi:predicted TIM-barrel fold metal-dependent hydrolase
MKLICVEEHVLGADIGAATQAAMLAAVPCLADWGSRVTDGEMVADPHRPHVVSRTVSARKALDMAEARLADMDAHGIDMQVLSYGGMPQLASPELNRSANDRLTEAIRAHPTRFAGFATLPWRDPDAAAQELKRAVGELGLKGALINGQPDDTFLDDARHAPVLEALNDLRVPLYIHPGLVHPAVQAAYYSGLEREIGARFSLFGWGWHHEAGIQVVRMMLAGIFDKYRTSADTGARWSRSSCSVWKIRSRRALQASRDQARQS